MTEYELLKYAARPSATKTCRRANNPTFTVIAKEPQATAAISSMERALQ
jgi:hypothetical protein